MSEWAARFTAAGEAQPGISRYLQAEIVSGRHFKTTCALYLGV